MKETRCGRHTNAAYSPINDYALIGDCHGSALVGKNGSIDWCCLARFDNDPIFCRILDAERGGHFQIQPTGQYRNQRRYLAGTNILETTFHTDTGTVVLTDFMPVAHDPHHKRLSAPHWLVRTVKATRGTVELTVVYRPCGRNFGEQPPTLTVDDTKTTASTGTRLYGDLPLTLNAGQTQATFMLEAGETHSWILSERAESIVPQQHAARLLAVTRSFWEEWTRTSNYTGRYAEMVQRSALAMKLLTYAPTGAVAAAPTTSLPERIGGERNWDYRYCWLRDATFTLFALSALGYHAEADQFNEFLSRCLRASHPELRILYGIEYETELPERTLSHLAGYCDSRPVRVGNGAYRQTQLDVYGEVLDWVLLFRTLGGKLRVEEENRITDMADEVAASWRDPGQGIWEMRSAPKHHVYSKIMCWVALDRAIRLFGRKPSWIAERETIAAEIMRRGIDRRSGYLTQAFDESAVDAAVLRAPLVGFPLRPDTLARTIDQVQAELGQDGYVRRYNTADSGDGVAGDKGAFVVCSFWLVDALLFADRYDEAVDLFERLLSKANDVGLFSEEIDPTDGRFLGNFPQALTHLALVRSAFSIHLYEASGQQALRGAHADRVKQRTEGLWRHPDARANPFSESSFMPEFGSRRS